MDGVLLLAVGGLVIGSLLTTRWPEALPQCPSTISYQVVACPPTTEEVIDRTSAAAGDLLTALTSAEGLVNQAGDDAARQTFSITSLASTAQALAAGASATLSTDLAPLQFTLSQLVSLGGSQSCGGLTVQGRLNVGASAAAGRWLVAQTGPLVLGGDSGSAWTALGEFGPGTAFSGLEGSNLLQGVSANSCTSAQIASGSCSSDELFGFNGSRWWQQIPAGPVRTWG